MCVGQDLKQFLLWNNFLFVFCKEFVVAVYPFLSSCRVVVAFGSDRLSLERPSCLCLFCFKKFLALS